jgi:hypothetical protein
MTAIARLLQFRHSSDGRGAVTLRYDDASPLAAVLDFGMRPDGAEIEWTIAREVLADGLAVRAGEGDVHCWTEGAWFHVALFGVHPLTNEPLAATVRLDADDVRLFLIDTEDLVPHGGEQVDFDAELSKLLIGGW